MKKFLLLSLIALVPIPCLTAQDLRTVSEPSIPPTCSSLDAQLSFTGNSLAAADEPKLDTARIQKAIDTCGKGQRPAPAHLRPLERLPQRPARTPRRRHPHRRQRRHPLCLARSGRLGGLPWKLRQGARVGRGCKPLISVNTFPAQASWETEPSTDAAERSCSTKTSLVGSRRRRPRRRPPAGSPPYRHRRRRQLHPLPHHPEELPQLPSRL